MDAAIQLQRLEFRWPQQTQAVLSIEQLHIAQGEHCFINGPSGSGKSTLLNLMAGIVSPQQGQIKLLDTEFSNLSAHKRDRFRADHLGIIFQQFNLLPYLSVEQNIMLPLSFSTHRARKEPQATERMQALMAALQLPKTLCQQPANQLSIGQQQRVAVARAMMGKPEIIIADEPTSALDTDNRDRFIEELFNTADQFNSTVVFVSHDTQLANHFSRQLDLTTLNQAETA